MNIDDELMAKAIEYTGIKERGAIVRLALEGLIARETERRLARLKGSLPDLGEIPARRRRDGAE